MRDYLGYIFDMDGVLYRGEDVIESAIFTVNALMKRDKKVIFVTNNSSRTNRQYMMRLLKIGIESVNESDIVTSGNVVVSYLQNEKTDKKNVLSIASEAVRQQLLDAKIEVIDPKDYRHANYVVVGYNQEFNWHLGNCAVNAVAIYGAKLIGTNPDVAKPVENNEIAAGTGAILAFVETASKTKAIVLGKPYPYIYHVALQRMGLSIKDVLMVGDLLETDIKGANGIGMDSALVLTGINKREDIDQLGIYPTFIIEDLSELLI